MNTMSFDFNFWTVANFCVVLFVAVSNRNKARADELNAVKTSLAADIKSIDQRVVEQVQRLASIESDVENGITKEDLAAVYERINLVVRQTGPMQGRLEEMSKTMDRLDQHLMQFLQARS